MSEKGLCGWTSRQRLRTYHEPSIIKYIISLFFLDKYIRPIRRPRLGLPVTKLKMFLAH